MSNQASKRIMMMRPKHFGFDEESAASNAFQNSDGAEQNVQIQGAALEEFNNAVGLLEEAQVEVLVAEDTDLPLKPNAVFPNNWVSFHDDRMVLYPMMAANRRAERRPDIFKNLGIKTENLSDLSSFESDGKYLESTGSLIFDYANKLVYACRSERTNEEVLEHLCELLDFRPRLFDAIDRDGLAIYHTNVMMCLAAKYAVICLESIPAEQQGEIVKSLEETNHEVVAITYDQMYAFAGNMIEVEDSSGNSILVMSDAAMSSLADNQKERLSEYSRLLSIPIPTIEKYGGGSIRCMICRID